MDVQIAKNGDGDYALGATIDGAFVPFANVAGHRVGHLVERAATLAVRAGDTSHEGHEQAKQALEDDWQVVKPASSSSTPPAEPSSTSTETYTETNPTGEGA
jgi:hypothetical protein